MKIGNWTLWAPAMALPALAWVAEGGSLPTTLEGRPEGKSKLVRVVGNDDAGQSFDCERWQAALTTDDLDRRESNFEELVELARHDPEARRTIEEWAMGPDASLAWTARLLRREVGSAGALFRADGRFTQNGLGLRFGDLHERVRELESMFEDLGRGYGLWVEDDANGLAPAPGAPGQVVRQESKSYRIEIGPDGARVHVTENVDGEQQVMEYEGESLEELFEANPELRERIQVRTGGADLWRDPFENLRRRGLLGMDPLLPRTDVLGIEYEAPSAALVDQLGLETGVGLVVLRTVPGTIAHILGIKRGDVVVEVNDNRLYSGDDVARVLRERQPEADVAVTLVDARGQQRTLTWHPIVAKTLPDTGAKPLEPR